MRDPRTTVRALAALFVLGALCAPVTQAVPVLQLYAPGATYDDSTDTWVISDATEFDLYVFTDLTRLETQTGQSTLLDLKVLVAYGNVGASVALTPITAAAPFVDPTLGLTPTLDAAGTVADLQAAYPEASPSLWNHDAVGAAVWAEAYLLGDSTADGSTIGDVTQGFDPSEVPGWTDLGQINAYHVTVSGLAEDSYVHFDAFDHVVSGGNCRVRYYKAPYSHDVLGGPPVPEPATLFLLGGGLFAAAGARRFRGSDRKGKKG